MVQKASLNAFHEKMKRKLAKLTSNSRWVGESSLAVVEFSG